MRSTSGSRGSSIAAVPRSAHAPAAAAYSSTSPVELARALSGLVGHQ